MPQGNILEGRYNFTDSIYDGLIKNNFLSSGLGFLTDGSLALADDVIDNGLGCIGWHAVHTPTPNIIFEFLDTRIFHSVTIHCNVRDPASIQLFSQVEVSFSNNGVTFNTTMSHRPKTITNGTGLKTHNISIDLCGNTGKVVRFNFSYAGDWILMSEITFNSGRSMLQIGVVVFVLPFVLMYGCFTLRREQADTGIRCYFGQYLFLSLNHRTGFVHVVVGVVCQHEGKLSSHG